jgi:hypothetical protein
MKKLDFLLIKKGLLVLTIAAANISNPLFCGDHGGAVIAAPPATGPMWPALQASAGSPALRNQSGLGFWPAPKDPVDGDDGQPTALHLPEDQPQIPYEHDDGSYLIPEQVIVEIVFHPNAAGGSEQTKTSFNIYQAWQALLASSPEEFEKQKQQLATKVQGLFEARAQALEQQEQEKQSKFIKPDPSTTGWRQFAQATAATIHNSLQTLKQFLDPQDPIFGPSVECFLQKAVDTKHSITTCSKDDPGNCINNVKLYSSGLLMAIGEIWSKTIMRKLLTDDNIELPEIILSHGEQIIELPECAVLTYTKLTAKGSQTIPGLVSCQCAQQEGGFRVSKMVSTTKTNWEKELSFIRKKANNNICKVGSIALGICQKGECFVIIDNFTFLHTIQKDNATIFRIINTRNIDVQETFQQQVKLFLPQKKITQENMFPLTLFPVRFSEGAFNEIIDAFKISKAMFPKSSIKEIDLQTIYQSFSLLTLAKEYTQCKSSSYARTLVNKTYDDGRTYHKEYYEKILLCIDDVLVYYGSNKYSILKKIGFYKISALPKELLHLIQMIIGHELYHAEVAPTRKFARRHELSAPRDRFPGNEEILEKNAEIRADIAGVFVVMLLYPEKEALNAIGLLSAYSQIIVPDALHNSSDEHPRSSERTLMELKSFFGIKKSRKAIQQAAGIATSSED